MESKILSIIVPVYNAENYIEHTIESILNQNLKCFELILVDDGSTDNSLQIMNQYNSYSNVKIFKQKNKGATFARNYGLQHASGKYILFFDSDDILNSNVLLSLIQQIEQQNADLLISNYQIVNKNLKILNEIKHENISSHDLLDMFCLIPFPGNKIFKKDILDKYHIDFDSVKIGQDLNFYLKYLIHANNVLFSSTNMTKYRIINNSISNSLDYRILDIIKSFDYIEQHFKQNNVDTHIYRFFYLAKLKHLVFQISKTRKIDDKKVKKDIYIKLSIEIKKVIKNIKITNFKELKFALKLILSYLKTYILYRL